MDRMTPPPNYYGAQFPGFNQGGQPTPPPAPNSMPNPMNNNSIPQPPNYTPYSSPAMEVDNSKDTQESISLDYSIADIANANRGKYARLYCSFPDSSKWHDIVIEGKIHYSAFDHIVIESESEPGKYIFVTGVFVNYMELFNKPIVPNKKSI